MTEQTKAVMTHEAKDVKIFTFDGATLIVSRGVHPKAGPGVQFQVIDTNNPGNAEPDEDGIKSGYAIGGNFNAARQRLYVAAAREGMDLDDTANYENYNWQRVQDLGDEVIVAMIAEFDEEAAEAEIAGFREVKPNHPGKSADLGELLAALLR